MPCQLVLCVGLFYFTYQQPTIHHTWEKINIVHATLVLWWQSGDVSRVESGGHWLVMDEGWKLIVMVALQITVNSPFPTVPPPLTIYIHTFTYIHTSQCSSRTCRTSSYSNISSTKQPHLVEVDSDKHILYSLEDKLYIVGVRSTSFVDVDQLFGVLRRKVQKEISVQYLSAFGTQTNTVSK